MADQNDDRGPEDFDPHEPGDCARCSNTGVILVCIDDICRAIGECLHGDGWRTCPDCNGDSAT